jgi:gamma-glutamyltranspeptidase
MKDGVPFLSFGLMGGDMQPQGHVQVLTDIIDFGMNVQEADDAARWRHYGGSEVTGEPSTGIGTVEMESGFDPAVKAELAKRGYTIVPAAEISAAIRRSCSTQKPRLLGRFRNAQGRRSDRVLNGRL